MPPTTEAIDRLMKQLRLDTPLIAVYDAAPGEAFELGAVHAPLIEAKGHTCCFAYYDRWLDGHTLVFKKGGGGCPGGHRAFGIEKEYPDYMAHFLTDGEGAPMGEGLKASPELAQEFLDNAVPPEISGDTVLIGPLRLEQWDSVRSVTFLVDPDRLAGVMTLAGFWSGRDVVKAPFSSGCGMMWRSVIEDDDSDPAVIGCTDMAMRKYLPPNMLSLSVSPARFEQMLTFPDDAFLFKSWWNTLMDSRGKGRRGSKPTHKGAET